MRICFIGDSFVNGTGDDHCLGWTGRICADARRRGFGVTLYNLGIRRDTTADIAARWQREAKARLAPEHDGRLVFSFGVNDCVSEEAGRTRVPEDASLDNARGILSTAKAWLPTLMIGPPPIADDDVNVRVVQLSRRLQSLCEELSVPFLSPYEPLLASGIWLREVTAGDGAHPNAGGYAALAELITQWPAWRSWVADRGSSREGSPPPLRGRSG